MGTPGSPATFWYTRNIVSHPVTEKVKCLYLPRDNYTGLPPGILAMHYSADWQAVVRGEKEAQSYRSGVDCDPPRRTGHVPERAPVVAVRSFGKGRVACYPIPTIYTGINYGNPLWSSIVESAGDHTGGRPSDGMTLQMNCYGCLRSRPWRVAGLGPTGRSPTNDRVSQVANWDTLQFGKPLGATPPSPTRTARKPQTGARQRTCGESSARTVPTPMARERGGLRQGRQATGLAFIVFTDPLEKLTAQTLDQLQADCAAASKDLRSTPVPASSSPTASAIGG